MNLKDNTTVIFFGRKFKNLISKLTQNPEYYPIKHNSKTNSRLRRNHHNMW